MSVNGKPNGKVKQKTQKVVVQLGDDCAVNDQSKAIEAELGSAMSLLAPEPVEPTEQQYKRAGRNWKYYQTIDWRVWWAEFNSELNPNGHRKYRSVWHFICKKTYVSWQRQALLQMIGKPPAADVKILEVPYLGDWEKRRRNECYVFEDLAIQVKDLELAIRQRTQSTAAVQALAPMIAQRMMYWYRIRDKVNEAFASQPLTMNDKVTSAQQEQRAGRFFRWMRTIENIIAQIEEQWMKVYGMNPLDPGQQVLNMAMAGQVGAAAALTGAAAGGGIARPVIVQEGRELPLPEGVTYDSLLFAQMLKEHEKTYNLPLPDDKKQTADPPQRKAQ